MVVAHVGRGLRLIAPHVVARQRVGRGGAFVVVAVAEHEELAGGEAEVGRRVDHHLVVGAGGAAREDPVVEVDGAGAGVQELHPARVVLHADAADAGAAVHLVHDHVAIEDEVFIDPTIAVLVDAIVDLGSHGADAGRAVVAVGVVGHEGTAAAAAAGRVGIAVPIAVDVGVAATVVDRAIAVVVEAIAADLGRAGVHRGVALVAVGGAGVPIAIEIGIVLAVRTHGAGGAVLILRGARLVPPAPGGARHAHLGAALVGVTPGTLVVVEGAGVVGGVQRHAETHLTRPVAVHGVVVVGDLVDLGARGAGAVDVQRHGILAVPQVELVAVVGAFVRGGLGGIPPDVVAVKRVGHGAGFVGAGLAKHGVVARRDDRRGGWIEADAVAGGVATRQRPVREVDRTVARVVDLHPGGVVVDRGRAGERVLVQLGEDDIARRDEVLIHVVVAVVIDEVVALGGAGVDGDVAVVTIHAAVVAIAIAVGPCHDHPLRCGFIHAFVHGGIECSFLGTSREEEEHTGGKDGAAYEHGTLREGWRTHRWRRILY